MDAPPIIRNTPAREALRDARGQIVGYLEAQRLTGKVVGRDARGIVVGVYDERADLTRDASGRAVAHGNALPALLLHCR